MNDSVNEVTLKILLFLLLKKVLLFVISYVVLFSQKELCNFSQIIITKIHYEIVHIEVKQTFWDLQHSWILREQYSKKVIFNLTKYMKSTSAFSLKSSENYTLKNLIWRMWVYCNFLKFLSLVTQNFSFFFTINLVKFLIFGYANRESIYNSLVFQWTNTVFLVVV